MNMKHKHVKNVRFTRTPDEGEEGGGEVSMKCQRHSNKSGKNEKGAKKLIQRTYGKSH